MSRAINGTRSKYVCMHAATCECKILKHCERFSKMGRRNGREKVRMRRTRQLTIYFSNLHHCRLHVRSPRMGPFDDWRLCV